MSRRQTEEQEKAELELRRSEEKSKAKSNAEPKEKSGKLIGRRYRYTNDYQVVPELGPNGGRGKRLVYVGRWIRPGNDTAEYKTIVLWMRILTATAVLFTAAALGLHPAAMTHRWYVPVLVASMFPLAYQVMGAAMLPGEISYMERRRYDKSFVRAGHSAMAALVMFGLSALGCVIYWIIVAASGNVEGSMPYSLMDGVFAALLVLAGAAELFTYRFFKRIKPDTFDNDAYHP